MSHTCGSSPILPEGCAPIGLKYLNISIFHDFGEDAYKSLNISSMNNLVRPYGFVAVSRADSVNGNISGSPYTVADEEKTKCGTHAFCNTCNNVVVPPMLAA